MTKRLNGIRLLFALGMALVMTWCMPLYAVLSIVDGNSNVKTVLPQGSEGAVLSFELQGADSGDDLFRNVVVNLNGVVGFGDGINSITVYRDTTGDNELTLDSDSNDTNIGSVSFSGLTSGTSLQVNVGTEEVTSPSRYFVALEINELASISATSTITLLTINESATGEINSFTPHTVSNTFEISGFSHLAVTDVAPDVVVPGQTRDTVSGPINMLQLALRVAGEDVNSRIGIRITNDEGNFVTDNTKTNGITKVYLYDHGTAITDPPSPENFNPANVIAELDADDFISESEALFYFPTSTSGPSGRGLNFDEDSASTANFLIMYDIGEDFSVTSNTQIHAEISLVTGNGAESNLQLSFLQGGTGASQFVVQEATAQVAGIVHDSLEREVPQGSSFGDESVVPMLRFGIRAVQHPFTLTQVTIENPATNTVPFATSSTDPEHVQKIQIFQDFNPSGQANGEFDGVDSIDRLVGELELGNGNQTDEATIPISFTSGGLTQEVTIASFNSTESYPSDNEVRFFAVYHMGTGIAGGDTAEAKLKTARGRATLSGVTHTVDLSGTLPAASTPDAIVNFADTNVYLLSVTDLSPTTAVQGQTKVPMIKLRIHSDTAITSSSMTIKNELKTFSAESNGITKVWIYRDDVPIESTFDADSSSITLVSASGSLTDSETVQLNNIPLFSGDDNYFFVAYDVGHLATEAAAAQLSAVGGNDTQSITFGGDLPTPFNAATFTPSSNLFRITNVTIDNSVITDGTGTFNINMTVVNDHSETLTLTSLQPRFYVNEIAGADVTYEFDHDVSTNGPLPRTMTAGQSIVFQLSAKHARRFTEGRMILDGFLEYVPETGMQAQIARFESGGTFFSASRNDSNASTATTVFVEADDVYPWTLPGYITRVTFEGNVNSGGSVVSSEKTFANRSALPKNSNLKIYFTDNGESIDDASIQLDLNGNLLTRTTSLASLAAQSTTYTYDDANGVISIVDVGENDGTLTLSVTDTDGNAFQSALIEYLINADLEISEALFYPNPFSLNSQDLRLGLNLSKSATLDVYFYNHLGRRVKKHSEDVNLGGGYHVINFGNNPSFLSSGFYVVRIVATSEGERDIVTTKLAVY